MPAASASTDYTHVYTTVAVVTGHVTSGCRISDAVADSLCAVYVCVEIKPTVRAASRLHCRSCSVQCQQHVLVVVLLVLLS